METGLLLIALIFTALISVGGGVFVLLTNNVLYAAYGFLMSLLGVAGIFVLCNAEFIAASQILIYIGGVLVILIYGILLSRNKVNPNVIQNTDIVKSLSTFSLIGVIIFIISDKLNIGLKKTDNLPTIKNLGQYLLTNQVIGLELVGMLLLLALIGSTYITKK